MICNFIKSLFISDSGDYIIAVFEAKNENDVPKGYSNKYFHGNSYFTAVGYFPTNEKVSLDLQGNWKKSKYGYQYEVSSFCEVIENTKEGIVAYLSSGVIKGIGEKTAERIVEKFGLETLNVLENNPELFLTIKGISRKKLDKIIKCFNESKGVRDIIKYLTPFGVTPNKCVKIYKNFGDDSLEVLKTNPYRLCNIYGFSFKTVDEIATKTNVALDDSLRIQGCMKFLLEDSLLQGHCCLNQRELLKKSYELLNEKSDREVCSMDKIKHELCYMAKVGALKGDRGYAYLPKYYDNECETANNIFTRVSRKNKQNELKTEKIISALAEIEKEEKMSLADKQREAVVMALKENFSIITGGPGVGKTTVLKFILKTFSKITGDKNIVLLAPTGRASRRMGESINNEYPASTIHSALKITMDEDGNSESQEEMINASIVVVDETSMCDASIFALLVKLVSLNSKIILLGDPEQLPSVGAGNVLYELLSNPYIPRTKLDVIFRQADTSLIVTNAKKISSGDTNLKYGLDFQLVKAFSSNGDEVANKVIEVFMNEYQDIKNLDNIQILTPMRKAGISAGATELNKKLQAIINPDKGQKTVKRHNTIFRVGDKVIQLKNTDVVSNGDIGYVTGIYEEDDDTVIEIKFANVTVKYDVTELDNVDLAYAISIHKFQGSECDTVVIPIIKSFYVMLKRNLIYTGITRGKKKVIIVGEPQAVAMAISRNDIQQRNTFLSARITELFEKLESKKQKAKAKSEQMTLFKN